MRMDPKHQFAAQYVLTRAANERFRRVIYGVNGTPRFGPGSRLMSLNRLRMGGFVGHVNYESKPPIRLSAPNGAGRAQVRALLAREGGVGLDRMLSV